MDILERLGAAIRTARLRRGWSQAKLARQLVDATAGVDSLEQATVSKWERGEHLPSLDFRPALRRLLGGEVARLLDAAEMRVLECPPTLGADKDRGEEDDTKRRAATAGLLASAAAAVVTPGQRAAIHAVRQSLTRTVAGDAAEIVNLEEWDEVAWEYGYTFMTTPPAVLIRDLLADFLAVQQLIEASSARTRGGYCRVASRLAVITAMTWASLGEHRQAWRWWRTSRVIADASGNLEARLWCRDWEVINGLYEQRPMAVILSRAEEAVALGGDHVTRGTVGLWSGIAQAKAVIGRTAEAQHALRQVESLANRLPVTVTRDSGSMYAWHEYRLRHTESYVYSHLRDTKRAYAAQDRALELYPDSMFRERAQLRMHRAACMVHDGDLDAGIEYARKTIEELPAGYKSNALVMAVGRKVVDAVPEPERKRDAFAELAGMIA